MSDFAQMLERARSAEQAIAKAVQTYQQFEPEIAEVVKAVPEVVNIFEELAGHPSQAPAA